MMQCVMQYQEVGNIDPAYYKRMKENHLNQLQHKYRCNIQYSFTVNNLAGANSTDSSPVGEIVPLITEFAYICQGLTKRSMLTLANKLIQRLG